MKIRVLPAGYELCGSESAAVADAQMHEDSLQLSQTSPVRRFCAVNSACGHGNISLGT